MRMGMGRESLFEKKDVVCAEGVSRLIGVGSMLSIVAVVNAIKSFRITECSNDLWPMELWGSLRHSLWVRRKFKMNVCVAEVRVT
jgi:hypothetical protein